LEEERWQERRLAWVGGKGSTPRGAGGSEGKKVKEGSQESNNGVKQAFWEVCPTLDPRHSRECEHGGLGVIGNHSLSETL
jgi:hypothetical protein